MLWLGCNICVVVLYQILWFGNEIVRLFRGDDGCHPLSVVSALRSGIGSIINSINNIADTKRKEQQECCSFLISKLSDLQGENYILKIVSDIEV